MDRRKIGLSLAGGGALLAAILIGLNDSSSPNATASAVTIPGGAAPKGCATKVHYMAYDAPAGSHNFGPDTKDYTSLPQAVTDFKSTACSDPMFFATEMEVAAHGLSLNATQTEQLAATYAHNHALWAKDVTSYLARAKFSLKSYNVSYDTLGQVPGINRTIQPKLIKSSQNVPLGQSLDVTINGRTINNRVSCHFQPSAKEIPNVPSKVTPPTKNLPPPPGTTSPPIGTPPPMCTYLSHSPVPVPPNGLCPKLGNSEPSTVPTQAQQHSPAPDNSSEIANGPVKPTDSGNGIPSGATTGPSAPRSTPAPAPTHVSGSATLPPPTESAAPPSNTTVVSGTVAPPPPPGG